MKHGDINRPELSPLPQETSSLQGLARQLPPTLYANLLDPAAATAPAATISGAPVKYSFKKEDEAVAPVEKKTADGT
jgi:hypothetical protein